MRTIDSTKVDHPFLHGLSDEHLDVLSTCAMELELEAGEVLFRQGDPANRFYLIESGEVALEAEAGEGQSVLIQTIGAGGVLGWSWMFPPYYSHFKARATQPTKAIFFYATLLREECERNHDLGYELMKRTAAVLIQRLEAEQKQLLALKKERARDSIAR